jgi:phospholipid/cholesterol/gamma-HCH transport system ATP-binding protein
MYRYLSDRIGFWTRRLGKLIETLKLELKLTSVVVTHDMRVAERLGDHVVFLDQGKVIFYGAPSEMECSPERIVQQFLQLDRVDIRSVLGTTEPLDRLAG